MVDSGCPPRVTECERCPLRVQSRSQIVNGIGPENADIMFVARDPGDNEDREGKPLIGPSGKILRLLCDQAHISPKQVYRTNSMRCWPGQGNRKPKKGEIENCHDYLIEEIRAVQPKCIVSLGEESMKSLMGTGGTIGSVAGIVRIQPDTVIPLISTYHPSWILRGNWTGADMVAEHFAKALRISEGENPGDLGDYSLIDTLAGLKALRDYLLSDECPLLALDTETTGLDWHKDEMLTVQFSGRSGEGFSVPFDKEIWGADYGYAIRCIREILASDKSKQLQNGIFDLRFLERNREMTSGAVETAYGFSLNGPLRDSMLTHQALHEGKTIPHNLTSLTAAYTTIPYYEEEIRPFKTHMQDAPKPVLYKYGAADTDAVARIEPRLRKMVEEEGGLWVLDNITHPMIRCCWEMEKRGILVDMKYFEKLCTYYTERVAEWEAKLWELVPHRKPGWKYLHAKTLQTVLFKELKLRPSGRRTDSGRGCEDCKMGTCIEHEQTGKDALKEIQELNGNPEILDVLLELKNLRKMKGTYLDGSDGESGFKRYIGPDNRIHPTWNPGGAETGRLSSKEPPSQTEPKNVPIEELGTDNAFRRKFIAPEGYGLMEADWSQAEVWGMAYMSGDKDLLAVLESGQDVHTWAARKMWPDLDSELTDYEWREEHEEERRKAKVFVFGTNYGLTAEGASLRGVGTVEEAEELIDLYMTQAVPGLKHYFKDVRKAINELGYEDNVFGRRRHAPNMSLLRACGAQNDAESIIREFYNFPIQGGCSDLHSLAHIATEAREQLRERRFFIVNAVHDSVLGEFWWPDNDYALKTAWILKTLWEKIARGVILPDGSPLDWHIPVEVTWGPSWGEMPYKLNARGEFSEPKQD